VGLLAWAFVGLVAGAVAQRITGTESRGCLATIAIGVIGAFLGGGLYRLLRGDDVEIFDEVDLFALLVATLGAVVLLLLLDALGDGGRTARRRRR
jgi:uncharacterized membrane protein YeaQ/YmgE (transglycosylase-associated protein family)